MFPHSDYIKPIIFLSRLSKKAEARYWPTELKVAGLIWVLRKIRHLVESAKRVVMFTDHDAIIEIRPQCGH